MSAFFKMCKAVPCVLLCLFFAECKTPSPLFSKYGNDASYFEGLRCLKTDAQSEAIKNFEVSAKKGSPLIQERSYKKLIETAPSAQKLSYAKKYQSQCKTQDSLLALCREYAKVNAHNEILACTKELDLQNDSNALICIRMESLLKTKPELFKSEFHQWALSRDFSSQHSYIAKLAAQKKQLEFLISFRDNVFNKKYEQAVSQAKNILQDSGSFLPQIIRDIGKAFLYGSKNFALSSSLLNEIISVAEGESVFYARYYEARLLQKAGQKQNALNTMLDAFLQTDDAEKQDQALWYSFSIALEINADTAVNVLQKYAKNIHDVFYFDDFFEDLCSKIFAAQKWPLIEAVQPITKTYASSQTAAHYSYVYARLIQAGLILSKQGAQKSAELFNEALSSGSDMYYRLLAAQKLNFSRDDFLLLASSCGESRKSKTSKDAEIILYGLCDAHLDELIYDEWLCLKENIGSDCALFVSKYLRAKSEQNEDFTYQSLRIASNAFFNTQKKDDALLRLTYPRYFVSDVKKSAADFSLPEYFLYALIRSESFFNKDVYSSAGAKGLTQLMDTTAGDIAKKLKVENYDLYDPSTNIKFGSYYLDEMIRRLDDIPLHAFFAYNAGISRVRAWLKQSPFKQQNADLFLESLPFAETREYGRKLTSASVLYSLLYYENSPAQVIEEIFK